MRAKNYFKNWLKVGWTKKYCNKKETPFSGPLSMRLVYFWKSQLDRPVIFT